MIFRKYQGVRNVSFSENFAFALNELTSCSFIGCCIYKKPRVFGESSSEDDSSDEEDQCKGPKEYHKKSKKQQKHEEHNHEKCNC